MNTDETPRQFTIAVAGLPGIVVAGVAQPIAVGPASTRLIALRLQAPIEGSTQGDDRERGSDDRQEQSRGDGRHEERGGERGHEELEPGPHKIEFTVRAVDDQEVVRHEKSSFIVPR